MKPIYLTKEIEEDMLKKFFEKFKKEWANFRDNLNDTKFSVTQEFSEAAKEKVTILFSQQAYLRMKALVDYFDTEVAWYGLVEKLEPKKYRVYDVRVCKQYVSGAKVDTEDEDTLEFFNSLTDDEAEHMHFQAHSHVKMSTGASCVDQQNQADVVSSMGKKGFYLFQIWNKQGEISSYVYDLDDNMYYDSKDVIIDIEDEKGTLLDYIDTVEKLVQEKKFSYPYQVYNNTYYKGSAPNIKKGKKKEAAYWEHGYYDERCDYMT